MTVSYTSFSTVPFLNVNVDIGYSSSFTVDAVDRTTGVPYDLTNCTATMTAVEPGSSNPAFVLTSGSGEISLGGGTGVITVTIPGSVTAGLTQKQLAYDVVVSDTLSVSLSIVRGFITIRPVA